MLAEMTGLFQRHPGCRFVERWPFPTFPHLRHGGTQCGPLDPLGPLPRWPDAALICPAAVGLRFPLGLAGHELPFPGAHLRRAGRPVLAAR